MLVFFVYIFILREKNLSFYNIFVIVQLPSCVQLFVTLWTAACRSYCHSPSGPTATLSLSHMSHWHLYIQCEIYTEKEWEFVTGLCQYPRVFDFSTLQCVLVCYMDLVILNIQNFGFPWHDKLRLKLTIFSAPLLYALRCWNTLTLFSFLIPVLVFSVKFSCSASVWLFATPWPGLPVHHQLPELAQTHVHRVCDAIQPSHPSSVIPFFSCLPSVLCIFKPPTLVVTFPLGYCLVTQLCPTLLKPHGL